MSIEWNISNRLRADALHKSVLDWGTLTTAADEIERLRVIEKAARDYYLGYVQDEADDMECCIVEEQHVHAKALRDALGEK